MSLFVVYLASTHPLRIIQPWSQDRWNQTKSNREHVRRRKNMHRFYLILDIYHDVVHVRTKYIQLMFLKHPIHQVVPAPDLAEARAAACATQANAVCAELEQMTPSIQPLLFNCYTCKRNTISLAKLPSACPWLESVSCSTVVYYVQTCSMTTTKKQYPQPHHDNLNE